MELRPTNLCNLRCPSCVARVSRPFTSGEELSADEYGRIIDEAAGLGVRQVRIVGAGEPFMRPEKTFRMMRRVKRYDMGGMVLTNGTLFDDKMIREIVEMGWDLIIFSLDGPNPEINDFLRSRQGSFERTTSAIREFSRLKNERGTRSPLMTVAPVLSHYNCHVIPDLIVLGAELGADDVLFQPVTIPEDRGAGRPFLLTKEDVKTITAEIPRAQEIAERMGIRTNLDKIDLPLLERGDDLSNVIQSYSSRFAGHPLLSIKCFSPWFYIGINPDGSVGPCIITPPTTHSGDIRTSTLKAFWEGEQFRRFRERLMRGELPSICRNCCGSAVIEINRVRERLKDVIDRVDTDNGG